MEVDNSLVINAIVKETAAKVVNSLDDETKKQIIIGAVANILEKLEVKWDIQQMLYEEAKKVARAYLKQPSTQQKIKDKVMIAVEEVIDGLAESIAGSIQSDIKSQYSTWIKERDKR